MTELSTAEAAVVQRFEAAADAEESLRERLAARLADEDGYDLADLRFVQDPKRWDYVRFADAAIAVIRGDL